MALDNVATWGGEVCNIIVNVKLLPMDKLEDKLARQVISLIKFIEISIFIFELNLQPKN